MKALFIVVLIAAVFYLMKRAANKPVARPSDV
jgi:hypothetical protein